MFVPSESLTSRSLTYSGQARMGVARKVLV